MSSLYATQPFPISSPSAIPSFLLPSCCRHCHFCSRPREVGPRCQANALMTTTTMTTTKHPPLIRCHRRVLYHHRPHPDYDDDDDDCDRHRPQILRVDPTCSPRLLLSHGCVQSGGGGRFIVGSVATARMMGDFGRCCKGGQCAGEGDCEVLELTWRNCRLPSPTRINLEEPVRVASPTRINLEEPVRVASSTRINLEEPISSCYPARLGLICSSVCHSVRKGQESRVKECKPY